MCNIYQGTFSKLTKANSALVNGRVIVILKKQYDGKASDCYIAYDYKTKKQLTYHFEKDKLIEVLNRVSKDKWDLLND